MPTLWNQDRPSAKSVLSGAKGVPGLASHAGGEGQNDSTTLHREIQSPNSAVCCTRQSSDLVPFFFLVLGIGAGDTMFGSLPVDPQPLENFADRFAGQHFGG